MEPTLVWKRTSGDAELDSIEGYQGATRNDSTLAVPPSQEIKSNNPFTAVTVDSRETTPLPSTGSSINRENSGAPPTNNDQTPNPAKRRKLTFAEKEIQRIEKQYRDQQKVEEKARKDEEKRVREEERRIKDDEMKEAKRKKEEEREEKRKLRDAEKQTKDEEKRKRDAEKKAKEDEKAKKEKVSQKCYFLLTESKLIALQSQLRLNSFFAKPTFPSGGSPLNDRSGPSSRRSSIGSVDEVGSAASVRSISVTPDQPQKSDYERAFPSFFVHSHTIIAPSSRFVHAADEHDNLQFQLHEDLEASALSRNAVEFSSQSLLRELLPIKTRKRRKLSHRIVSVKDLVAGIHGSAIRPIDLTKADHGCREDPLTLLKTVPVKYLRYAEDVRPPYIGTYSKVPVENSGFKLSRKPFTRALPATNYDYDSEAEWEEPEDGEDLDSEGEEEFGDEDEADDMAEFLDDDDAEKSGAKRRNIMGDVQPVCTGLHWEDSSSRKRSRMVPYGEASIDLGAFRSEVILGKRSSCRESATKLTSQLDCPGLWTHSQLHTGLLRRKHLPTTAHTQLQPQPQWRPHLVFH